MEENHLKTFSFFVKFVILLQLVYCIINHKCGAEATQSELYHRMSKVEAQNQHQEKEISLLKMGKVEDRKEIHQLRERVALLESSPFYNSSSVENLGRRSERPARLLSFLPRKNKTEEETTSAQRFNGPPTSCNDLNKLGYTLNGYYLIKGEGTLDIRGIRVTYCKFNKPTGVNLVSEAVVGLVDVKTKTVHFYVQRDSPFYTKNAVIPFDFARLNEENAFNLQLGIFNAPVPGIYHFDFSALKGMHATALDICLQVNGDDMGHAHANPHYTGSYDTISLSASLRLMSGDTVNLWSSGGMITDDERHFTHFTGWLVEELLTAV